MVAASPAAGHCGFFAGRRRNGAMARTCSPGSLWLRTGGGLCSRPSRMRRERGTHPWFWRSSCPHLAVWCVTQRSALPFGDATSANASGKKVHVDLITASRSRRANAGALRESKQVGRLIALRILGRGGCDRHELGAPVLVLVQKGNQLSSGLRGSLPASCLFVCPPCRVFSSCHFLGLVFPVVSSLRMDELNRSRGVIM